MYRKPVVQIAETIPPKQYNFPWIDNKFVHYKDLFPDWPAAEETLIKICDNVDLNFVGVKSNCPQDLHVCIVIPHDVVLPNKQYLKIYEILHRLKADYTPDLDRFVSWKVDVTTIATINEEIKAHEYRILMQGGRPIRQELAFRLGLLFYVECNIGVENNNNSEDETYE